MFCAHAEEHSCGRGVVHHIGVVAMVSEREAVSRLVDRSMSEVDKTFSAIFPIKELSGCGHYVWVVTKGGFEVRNERSTEIIHQGSNRVGATGSADVWSILAVPDPVAGLQVWMGMSSGAVEVYDAQTFALLHQQTKHTGGVYCLAEFGGYVYSGSNDFKIGQWYAADARPVRMLYGHSNYVRCLYAEGNAVVSGSDDCTVRVWDVGSGDEQLTGRFHERSGVSALCRVGVTMWSGDDSGRVVLWRLDTCEALHILQAHSGRVSSLKKVGSRVYSGGADGVIAVFDAEEGHLLSHVNNYHGVRVSSLVVTSELRRFCIWSCSADKVVQCWYQDEYCVMMGDQERFSESFWYERGSTPYHEFRDSVVKHINNLRETLKIKTSENPRLADIVGLSNSASSAEGFRKREANLSKELSSLESRQSSLECQLERSKEVLHNLERETELVLGILKAAQAELNALDPVARSSLGKLLGSDRNHPVAGVVSSSPGHQVIVGSALSGPGCSIFPDGSTTARSPSTCGAAANVGDGESHVAAAPGQPGSIGAPSVPFQPAAGVIRTTGADTGTISDVQSGHPVTQMSLTPVAGGTVVQFPTSSNAVGASLQPADFTTPTGTISLATPAQSVLTSATLPGTAVSSGLAHAPLSGSIMVTAPSQVLGTSTAGGAVAQLLDDTATTAVCPPPQSVYPAVFGGSTAQVPGGTAAVTTLSQPFGAVANGGTTTVAAPGPDVAGVPTHILGTVAGGGLIVPSHAAQLLEGPLRAMGVGTSVTPAELASFLANTGSAIRPLDTSSSLGVNMQPHVGEALNGSVIQPGIALTGIPTELASAGQILTASFHSPGSTAVDGSTLFAVAQQSLAAQQQHGILSAGETPAHAFGGVTVAAASLQGACTVLPADSTVASNSAHLPLPVAHHGIVSPSKHVHFERPTNPTERAGAVYNGVEWTNKNVGNYILRRYYGAEPSLRTPAIEKRKRLQARIPDVKLEPFRGKKQK